MESEAVRADVLELIAEETSRGTEEITVEELEAAGFQVKE